MAAPILLTMGEPAGIGGEITLMAWRAAAAWALPPFAVIDDAVRLKALAHGLGLDVPVKSITDPGEAAQVFAKALPVLDRPLPVSVRPGTPDPRAAQAVIQAIDEALALTLGGQARAIVTNPIHKASLYSAGFRAPGHTEYLADLIGTHLAGSPPQPVMMLVGPSLRVVPVTVHLSLAAAIHALTREKIVEIGKLTARALVQDFKIANPRLAIAALNPHAGEEGTIGREEIDIIEPAAQDLRQAGIAAAGPFPADTLFHADARKRFDAVLCMYHDQALIPLKTIDFAHGVNVTLGLPIIRTSPDHGTAFDIAGSGKANPTSLIEAIALAGTLAANRQAPGPGERSAGATT